jgi:aspartate aminotransferase
MKAYTIFIDGISKAFASTGVRVGWAMGPADLIQKMKAINSHLGAWAPMAEQNAVAKYLLQTKRIDSYLATFKAALEDRLTRIYSGLKELKKAGEEFDVLFFVGSMGSYDNRSQKIAQSFGAYLFATFIQCHPEIVSPQSL